MRVHLPSTKIATRLLVAFVVPTALVVVVNGYVAYLSARDGFRDQYARRLEVLATTIGSQINPDEVLALLPGDERARWYLKLAAELDGQKRAADLSALYLINGRGEVLIDADRQYRIEQRLEHWASDASAVVRATHRGGDTWVEDTDKLNPSYRAYKRLEVTPSTTVAGAVDDEDEVLLLGIESELHYLPVLRKYALTLIPLGALAILAVTMIALVVSRTITKPVRMLVKDARRIGSGELDAVVKPRGSDEIGFLARTLDEMRSALATRDRDRQAMLAGIAHEVRNPLGGMELFLGLLAEGVDEMPERPEDEEREQLKEYASRVKRELGYLKGVVNDFLAFAREAPVTKQTTHVGQLFEEVLAVAAPEAEQLGIQLHAQVPTQLTVEADTGAIHRSLLNLVQNAMQATASGGEVTLRAEPKQQWVHLTVADSGKGIPEDKLAEVTVPFFTTREKGTGLGLAIVSKLARAHGGQLLIESEVGKGTEVTLQLPVDRSVSVLEATSLSARG